MRRDSLQYRRMRWAGLALAAALTVPVIAAAQSTPPHSHPSGTAANPAAQDQDLQKQIAELRAQVAKLQAALDQQKQTPTAPTMPVSPSSGQMKGEMSGMGGGMSNGEMGGMGASMPKGEMGMKPGGMSKDPAGKPAMGMMDMDKGEMGMPPDGMKMPGGPAPSTGGSAGMGGMNMGGGNATSPATPPRTGRSMSSLPGIPGATHVYHVGSTGFFLDQPQLQLTAQQQAAFNRIKERALLERETANRRIEQADQELWTLTAADQPDAAKIQAKLQEIERLRTDQRFAYIRAVGEAAKQLTPEQQNVLLGTSPSK